MFHHKSEYIMPYFLLSIVLLSSIKVSQSQESAQYLRNVIKDLRQIKEKSNGKRIIGSTLAALASTPSPLTTPQNRRHHHEGAPDLGLSKDELASLYQAAIAKGQTVKLNTGDNSYVNAAIHEIDDGSESNHYPHDNKAEGDDTGYYYYYYPIKSFLSEMLSHNSEEKDYSAHPTILSSPLDHEHSKTVVRSSKPQYQIHTHTHQHNVKIAPIKTMPVEHKKHKLEPLFMAISGFIGMAVMFVLSIFMFPKWGKKTIKKKNLEGNKMDDLARIALQAIEGKYCTERFACELGKTARSLNLHDNRFIKLLRHIAPVYLTRQFMGDGQKQGNRQLIKCAAIPCKKKPTAKPPPRNKQSRNKPKRS